MYRPDRQRDREGDHERDGRDRDVLAQPRRDAVGAGPVRRVGQPGDGVADERHARRPTCVAGLWARGVAHGVMRRCSARAGVGDEGEQDRGDGPEVELGREAAPVALEDEEAQAAEAVAQDRGHGHEADRRHGREAQAGHDQRHGQRHLDAPQPLAAV